MNLKKRYYYLLFIGFTSSGLTQTISTVGSGGYCTGVALDKSRNIYVADNTDNIIIKIDAVTLNSIIIAGSLGNKGYAGDGGSATAAYLYMP